MLESGRQKARLLNEYHHPTPSQKPTNVVLVTGAAGSIGKAIVETLLSEGIGVIALDKCWTDTEEPIKNELLRVGFDIKTDIQDAASFGEMAKTWLEKFYSPKLIGIVNNAAVQIVRPYYELSKEDWLESLSVNIVGPAIITSGLRDHLRASKGAVVNVGSVHESNSKSNFAAYAASKAALASLGRVVNLEESGDLRIFTIAPGAVDTPMLREGFNHRESLSALEGYQPLRRLAQPGEVAKVIIDLIMNGSPLLSGSTIRLDGGIHGKLHDPA